MPEFPFQSWIDKTANYGGVMACGVRQPDQATQVKSYHESLAEARLKELMQKLTEVAFNLRQSQLGGARLRWAFEFGALHIARRLDGAMAVLAVTNDPGNGAVVEELMAEFMAFQRPPAEPPTAAGG